jgi:CMP-N-acetylneuraminic acid synthetase
LKFLAIIPARKGSKGVKNKNIKLINKKPLIEYTINSTLTSELIDRIIVSTNDKKIIKLCKKKKVEFIVRPENLSNDKSNTLECIKHVLKYLDRKENYHPDAIITLQPTSPLRTTKHINDAIKLFKSNEKADSLVSCESIPNKFYPFSSFLITKDNFVKKNFKKKEIYIRQNKINYYSRNGAAIYITRRNKINNYIIGGKILAFRMDKISSIDIDDHVDFMLAEFFLKKFYRNVIK